MRLNAFLAKAGVASRRAADELIKNGKVKVNGRIGQLNDEVTDADEIKIGHQSIKLQQNRYIILNKPTGYVTTLKDPQGRPKILDLLSISERVVPVGRLDMDTTGAILLTNDGRLAHKLMHPSHEVDKVYEAEVKGQVTDEKLRQLATGIELEGSRTAPAKARKLSDSKVELIIHEGKKHQVKKMLAAVGLPVQTLHRAKYGPLDLSGLKPGEWRELSDKEVAKLR